VSILSDLQPTTINMMAAVLFGGIVGMERQARNQIAGVRTNALVALGAASFVTFATLFPGDVNTTRVAAQIISGVGFLGAGIIFRDGLNVLGLNTAATLWCSAAVGMFCGAGNLFLAMTLTLVLLLVNLFLRPLVSLIDRYLPTRPYQKTTYRLTVAGPVDQHGHLRSVMLLQMKAASLALTGVEEHHLADGTVALVATVTAAEAQLTKAVALLAAVPGVQRVDWTSLALD
jgi:putative Mg2+ transporter-C (MgtC) family protein